MTDPENETYDETILRLGKELIDLEGRVDDAYGEELVEIELRVDKISMTIDGLMKDMDILKLYRNDDE